MKRLVLAIMVVFLSASITLAAEKSNDLLMPITETLEITTNDMLSAESWKKDLEDALKNHFVAAKEVAKAVFPSCEEFSVVLNTKIGSGILTTITVTSRGTCKKFKSPKPSP